MLIAANPAGADMAMNDNPVIVQSYVKALEYRAGSGENSIDWENAELRIGTDLNKLALRSSGEWSDGEVHHADLSILYSRAVSAYWNLQAGWKRDIRPKPHRDWFTVGLSGISPYHFDSEIFISVGRDGNMNLYLEAEKEILVTQRIILAPAFTMDVYNKDDPEYGIGSGVSETEIGLRLRYAIRKNFLPYIGINWVQQYGDTAELSRLSGDKTSDTRWVFGFKGWY